MRLINPQSTLNIQQSTLPSRLPIPAGERTISPMEQAVNEVIEIVKSVPPDIIVGATLAGGFVLLFFGWRLYQIALVSIGVLWGGALGALIAIGLRIAFEINIPPIVLAIPLGVVMGLLTPKLQKIGAFIVGGLCGAIPILATQPAEVPGNAVWLAAGVAFLLCGILAVLLWRPMIVLSLAVIGSKLLVVGTFGAADRLGHPVLREKAADYPYVVAAAMGVLTLLGVLFQMRKELGEDEEEKKPEKKDKKESAEDADDV